MIKIYFLFGKRNILFLFFCFFISAAISQNVYVSMQADNSGKVQVGNSFFLKIYIGNSSSTLTVAAYKLRPLFFIPNNISVAATGHILPDGWTMLSSDAGSFRLSNGTGTIPPNTQREILIRMNGDVIGGPSSIQANIQFANGLVPGTAIGAPTSGNLTGDDVATIFIEVVSVLPVTLADFNATLVNCQALMQWTTKTEQNSDRFEIEKSMVYNGHWESIGKVKASGTSYSEVLYSFVDKNLGNDAGNLFYRLKTIDKDGSFRYSRVINLPNSCRFSQIMVYPNPVLNSKLFVNLAGTNGLPEASIISLSGQLIKKFKLVNGANNINLQGLTDGIYELLIQNDNGIIKRVKILVQ